MIEVNVKISPEFAEMLQIDAALEPMRRRKALRVLQKQAEKIDRQAMAGLRESNGP
jgi:hypothetical protein